MLLRISKKVASFWSQNGIIPDEYQDAYIYGIQLLLSTAINIICMIMISWLLGKTFAWIPFMIGFVPLRMTAGGYHAKTPFKCGVMFCGTYAVALLLIHGIPDWAQVPVIWINSVITLLIVFIFSPAPATNKPLTTQEAQINRNRSILIVIGSILFVITSGECNFLKNSALYVSCGQSVCANFLCLYKIRLTKKFK